MGVAMLSYAMDDAYVHEQLLTCMHMNLRVGDLRGHRFGHDKVWSRLC